MKLVQCVPNFSEGRDKAKVDAIVAAIAKTGVFIMDVEMDPNHNRSVVTFFGSPEAVVEGAVNGAAEALKHIDMKKHRGEHPRMGATDVVPFTPVLGVSMEDCVKLAVLTGERLANELKIPVYLYGRAARRPERANLAYVRKGEYEGIAKEIGVNPERAPDFGEPKMHPRGGATAVGAREHIINFNVNLKSRDMAWAAAVAKAVRTSGGGLPELRAKEIELVDKGQVQISMVLTHYAVTGLDEASRAIEEKARAAGIEIENSELIGLVPARALIDFALKRLKVTGFDPEKQVFENKLLGLLASAHPASSGSWNAALASLLQALASPEPVPGGGSASAVMGAMGASLAEKVCHVHRRRMARAGSNGQQELFVSKALRSFESMRTQFIQLAQQDSDSYAAVASAYKMPKEKGIERAAAIEQALQKASSVPLQTMHLALKALQSLSEYKPLVPPSVLSDFKVACYAMAACARGAMENVLINLEGVKDPTFRHSTQAQITALDSRLKEFTSAF